VAEGYRNVEGFQGRQVVNCEWQVGFFIYCVIGPGVSEMAEHVLLSRMLDERIPFSYYLSQSSNLPPRRHGNLMTFDSK